MLLNLLSRFFSIFFLLFSIECFGQFEVITYDFEKKAFDKPFPFDVPFRVKFISIDATVKRIEISIKNITHTRRIMKDLTAQGKLLTNEHIFNHKDAPNPLFEETMTITDRTAVIDIVSRLKPNQTYFVEIEAGALRNLNTTEKDILKTELEGAPFLANFLSKLATDSLTFHVNSSGVVQLSAARIENYRQQLFSEVNSHLISMNLNYRLLNVEEQYFNEKINNMLLALSSFQNNYNELNSNIKSLGINFSADSIIALKTSSLSSLPFLRRLEAAAVKAKKNYEFDYRDDVIMYLQNITDAKTTILKTIVDDVLLNSFKYFTNINHNYPSTPSERANNYVFADVGYGYTFAELQTPFSFTGVSIYMRPINTSIPLSDYNDSFSSFFLSRFSFLIGMNLSGKIDEPNIRKGFLNDNKTVLLGAGFRLFQGMKLNGGCIVYQKFPSPLITKPELAGSTFISLSLDFGITSVFSNAIKRNSVLNN